MNKIRILAAIQELKDLTNKLSGEDNAKARFMLLQIIKEVNKQDKVCAHDHSEHVGDDDHIQIVCVDCGTRIL